MTIRRLGWLILTLAVFVATTSVAAGAAKKDKVVGSAKRISLAGQPLHIVVMAQSGPNGEEPSGSYSVTRETSSGSDTHRGTIYCLTVEGNRANMRAVVEESSAPEILVGSGFGIAVTDNGKADTNINYFGLDPNVDTDCGIFSDPPELPIGQGNFVVSDAIG